MNHSEITSFIWRVADLIRDTFKRGKYQDVILPLTVLRRIESHSGLHPTMLLGRPGSNLPNPAEGRWLSDTCDQEEIICPHPGRGRPGPAHAGGVGAA